MSDSHISLEAAIPGFGILGASRSPHCLSQSSTLLRTGQSDVPVWPQISRKHVCLSIYWEWALFPNILTTQSLEPLHLPVVSVCIWPLHRLRMALNTPHRPGWKEVNSKTITGVIIIEPEIL